MTERPICPLCSAKMVLQETKKFTYRNGQPRKFWGCSMWPECKGIHGAHPDGAPLGRPGTPEEKKARIAAHDAFDPLWKERFMTRRQAYKWLSRELGTKIHMGGADVALCNRIIEICQAEVTQRRTESGIASPHHTSADDLLREAESLHRQINYATSGERATFDQASAHMVAVTQFADRLDKRGHLILSADFDKQLNKLMMDALRVAEVIARLSCGDEEDMAAARSQLGHLADSMEEFLTPAEPEDED